MTGGAHGGEPPALLSSLFSSTRRCGHGAPLLLRSSAVLRFSLGRPPFPRHRARLWQRARGGATLECRPGARSAKGRRPPCVISSSTPRCSALSIRGSSTMSSCPSRSGIDISLAHYEARLWPCPECESELPLYDHAEERAWRHLDTGGLPTWLHARPPRVKCPTHGVRAVTCPGPSPRAASPPPSSASLSTC